MRAPAVRVATVVVVGMLAVQLAVAVAISLTPNPEGWLGGILYAFAYGIPVVLLLLGLRSRWPGLRLASGILATIFGLYFVAIPILNWSLYATSWEVARALAASIPPVIACAAIAWAGLLRRPRPRPTT